MKPRHLKVLRVITNVVWRPSQVSRCVLSASHGTHPTLRLALPRSVRLGPLYPRHPLSNSIPLLRLRRHSSTTAPHPACRDHPWLVASLQHRRLVCGVRLRCLAVSVATDVGKGRFPASSSRFEVMLTMASVAVLASDTLDPRHSGDDLDAGSSCSRMDAA
jgi:hypothetical protein